MSARDVLARLTALCERATAGPWAVEPVDEGHEGFTCYDVIRDEDGFLVAHDGDGSDEERSSNAAFIAEARSAFPAALACLLELIALADSHDASPTPAGHGAVSTDLLRAVISRHFPTQEDPK